MTSWRSSSTEWTHVEGRARSEPTVRPLLPLGGTGRRPLPVRYGQGSTIDWMHEEAEERALKQAQRYRRGAYSSLSPMLESAKIWSVLIISGALMGYVGGMLDILVAWLSDFRTGRCSYGLLYNQSTCCAGLDASEICREWMTWGHYVGIKSSGGQAMLQSFMYIGLGISFAAVAAVLVQVYAPYAIHSGIPEIKAILGGLVLDEFLSSWTLLIKAVGLALAVASGLSLGKEGPLVHISCCIAAMILRVFSLSRFTSFSAPVNEAEKRKIWAAAATAGVAVAFGSPLGGVLFGLEELDSALFNDEQLMWRAFVISVGAATTLAYIDPFSIGKLVLFQVTTSQQWRQFELVPWLILGLLGGVLGALLINLNVRVAVYRETSPLKRYPLLEVMAVAAVTAILSWPVVFMRDQSSTLVANLFVECDSGNDYHGLCNAASYSQTVFLLLVTAFLKMLLTAWTFGMKLPAGIFLPTIAIGACLGRSLGLVLQAFHQAYPTAWIFSSCPPEGTCIYPGFYSVIGAAALLGGVTRTTVSLVVILFELTGALSHVLPIMLAVMASKFVGDYFGKGVYDTWVAMHGYPHIPALDYRDHGETAGSVMNPIDSLIMIEAGRVSKDELEGFLSDSRCEGFPVLDDKQSVIGYVTSYNLRAALDTLPNECSYCQFSSDAIEDNSGADLRWAMNEAPLQMTDKMPLQVVVSTFQRLSLDYLLLTSNGRLSGTLRKRDIAALLSSGFEHRNALAQT